MSGKPLDEARRAAAAYYLKDRTLEEALASWRADYDAPTFRQRRASLARLGTVIRRLAADAEVSDAGSRERPARRMPGRGPKKDAEPRR